MEVHLAEIHWLVFVAKTALQVLINENMAEKSFELGHYFRKINCIKQ